MPKTLLGRWSVGLAIAFFLLLATLALLAKSGQEGGETFSDNLLLAVPGLLSGVSGVAAFFTGVAAILRRKERSPLVFLATLIGLLVLLFVLGEVSSPH